MNRYRPNLVVRGASAYGEDGGKTVAIGDILLRLITACKRCVSTTTDQMTGERESREPLATLSRRGARGHRDDAEEPRRRITTDDPGEDGGRRPRLADGRGDEPRDRPAMTSSPVDNRRLPRDIGMTLPCGCCERHE
jgi:hypothetical protein